MGLVLVLCFCRLLASWVLPVYDDAFITLRYAKQWAQGVGLVYTSGEWVLGTTAPGFALLNGIFFKWGLPMPQTTVGLNILIDGLILYATLRLLGKRANVPARLTFATLFSLSPILNRICVGGMEANLFLLGSLITIYLFLNHRYLAAFSLATLLYLLRPEAVLLLSLLWLFLVKRNKKQALFYGLASGAILSAMLLFFTWQYGQPFSQSVIAKSQLPSPSVGEVLQAFFIMEDPLVPAFLPLALLGLFLIRRQNPFVQLIAIWTCTYLFVYLVARPVIWSWYGIVLYYGLFLLAALAVNQLLVWIPSVQPLFYSRWGQLGWAILPLVAWIALSIGRGASGVREQVYEPLADWCRQISPQSHIAAYDIGAVGYYCPVPIYDLAGLVWQPALQHSSPVEIVATYQPDYLFFTATQEFVAFLQDTRIQGDYQPVRRFSPAGESLLTLDASQFPSGWRQDYILFERVVP